VEKHRLEALVEEGLSIRRIAATVGLSATAVRHWLGVHGLQTARARRRREHADARGRDAAEAVLTCAHHGQVRHVRVEGRGFRCASCRSEAVTTRRRRVKEILVAEAGGSCTLCGYDRSMHALQFHHLDPRTKAFHLSSCGVTRSLERARAEARKCVLLCANCHAEVEGGVASVPAKLPASAADHRR
jgi:transposase